MKKLYKVTESTTTVFVSDRPVEQAHELRVEGSRWCERERENNLPKVEVVEVKSLDDLPAGWTGEELLWGVEDAEMQLLAQREGELTAKRFFSEFGRRREEEIERLKSEIESLASRLRELGDVAVRVVDHRVGMTN